MATKGTVLLFDSVKLDLTDCTVVSPGQMNSLDLGCTGKRRNEPRLLNHRILSTCERGHQRHTLIHSERDQDVTI